MAQQKMNIARLVLQAISILGILCGFAFFSSAIVMIFWFPRDNLTQLCILLIMSVWMVILGAFMLYPSYKMLRGRSFGVIKSISALLALISFSSVMQFADVFITTLESEKETRFIGIIVNFASFLFSALVFAIVYKVSVKLLERLRIAAYGPKNISETQNSTDKQ